jgi:hypothetical protein
LPKLAAVYKEYAHRSTCYIYHPTAGPKTKPS